MVHVAGYASRFLFTSEQLNQPVERLSGGERARVLIARLMLQPADVLILDEPTNDLDIPTLEILEESLLEFPGALVLVTHDRYLLDRVTNAVLGLDGRGNAALFADYLQWEAWREQQGRVIASRSRKRDGVVCSCRVAGLPASAASSVAKEALLHGAARVRATGKPYRGSGRARLPPPNAHPGCRSRHGSQSPHRSSCGLEAAKAEHHAVYERWVELTEKIGG